MSRGQDAVVHIREERAVVGGVQVAKKTVIAVTDGGVSGNNNPSIGYPGHAQRAPLLSYPQQGGYPTSRPVVIADPPERDCSYHCFACDGDYKWYDPEGKGICWVLLLVLFWLLVGAIVIALFILYCVIGTLCETFCGKSDE
ncbi:unnamed protein product [Porites lobata]|uniref:Uncharacterized protein n=1 Tax=Porites lobata TaxID=104759 RepID=A0ABN8NI83_9CNID|nr:unnamed protein product [Porites lobata]